MVQQSRSGHQMCNLHQTGYLGNNTSADNSLLKRVTMKPNMLLDVILTCLYRLFAAHFLTNEF